MRKLLVLMIAALALIAVGCDFQLIEPQPNNTNLRYRDEIFAGVTKTSNLTYGSAPNQNGQTTTLTLDLYQPTGDTIDERPAIVWIHGGGFSGGSKTSAEIVDQANVFTRKGYVNVSISYRLSESGCSAAAPTSQCIQSMIDAQHDAQAAVRWLRANANTYDIDADRIAVAGSSAGAITALHVGYGPNDPGSSGNSGYPSNVDAAISLSGASLLQTPSPGEAWALLLHGTSDSTVPYAWAQNTSAQAAAVPLEASLTSWQGAGHVPYVAHRTEIIQQSTYYLYWALDLTNAAR